MPDKEPKVVVIGGGNGTSTVLKGLRKHTPELTAVVSMADDGGSTGELRYEMGVMPPGDIRRCLEALGNAPELEKLFEYRFQNGRMSGHSFGNLFISAAEQMTGGFEEALAIAEKVLQITGRVLPVTTDDVNIILNDGDTEVRGEDAIYKATLKGPGRPQVHLDPPVNITPRVHDAIMEADFVVIAPGNIYCSLAPALLAGGMREALEQTSAKVIYVCNLVNTPRHTPGFSVNDHASEMERFIGASVIDVVLYSTTQPQGDLLREGETGVSFDDSADTHYEPKGLPLLDTTPPKVDATDKIAHLRASARHDSDAVAQAIIDMYEGKV